MHQYCVESGVDIPNVNTIIVNNDTHQFGLGGLSTS